MQRLPSWHPEFGGCAWKGCTISVETLANQKQGQPRVSKGDISPHIPSRFSLTEVKNFSPCPAPSPASPVP
eukprot:scaffold235149_cov36-Prasinocladus_malaysianus.AAC.1